MDLVEFGVNKDNGLWLRIEKEGVEPRFLARALLFKDQKRPSEVQSVGVLRSADANTSCSFSVLFTRFT